MSQTQIIAAFITYLVLDGAFIWMNNIMFHNQIIDVQRVVMKPKPMGFIAGYAVLLFAFYFFVLRTHRPIWEASLLGFVIHATYELTSYTLLKKWRLETVIVDTLWGATLWGLTAFVAYTVR